MSHRTEAKKKFERKTVAELCHSVAGLTNINCIPQNLVCYLKKKQQKKNLSKKCKLINEEFILENQTSYCIAC